MRLFRKITVALSYVALLSSCASSKESVAKIASPPDVQRATEEAYIYAYPLVTMGISRDVMTAVPRAGQSKAPLNQVANMRKFPDDRFTDVVTPNADTLYSMSWLDLSQEPVIISVPEAGNRYYMLPLLSAWTDVFASPGSRTTGNHANNFAVTGPGWSGTLPANVQQIKAPTNSVWMIGRTKASSGDYERIYSFQDRLRVTPLSMYGKNLETPMSVPFNLDVDIRTPPVEQVDNMDARTFFTYFANELKQNPPAAEDRKMIDALAKMGITPGRDFDYAKLNPEAQKAFNSGYFAGQEKMAEAARRGDVNMNVANGWGVSKVIGTYGDDYMARALIAKYGLGANIKQDAVYPKAMTDASGQRLNGSNKYVLRFAKGKMPPVNGFWSLSMYNTRNFFVKNPLNRFAIGDRDKLKVNRDGSTDIYVQSTSPGKDKESNWLPAPAGEDFAVVMRLYWPKQAVLDGSWKMPGIERVPEFKNLSDNLR